MSGGRTVSLSLSQRFSFDSLGYILLKGVLTSEEVEALRDALRRMAADPELEAKRVYSHERGGAHSRLFGHLVEYDPALLAYAAHPKLIPLVEEVVGGAVRLEESEAILSRRDPAADETELFSRRTNPTGFHTGARATWGGYYEQNRFHCLFVKTLAYLTEVGPDDGGTTVIPGSHRMTWPQQEMIAAAQEDERLIHQVEAEAGDVLLFPETLIHSSTAIRSDRERMIVVSGYTPPMLREWMRNEINPEFVAGLPEEIRPLISGSDNWRWRRNY